MLLIFSNFFSPRNVTRFYKAKCLMSMSMKSMSSEMTAVTCKIQPHIRLHPATASMLV